MVREFCKKWLLRYMVPTILAISLVVGLVFVSWDEQIPVAAQLTRFYATDCDGGWKNSNNAIGEPTVFDGGYTPDNSAVFLDNAAEIRCSGFVGELPPQTYHTRAFLRVSWNQPNSQSKREEEKEEVVEKIENSDDKDIIDTKLDEGIDSSSDIGSETVNDSNSDMAQEAEDTNTSLNSENEVLENEDSSNDTVDETSVEEEVVEKKEETQTDLPTSTQIEPDVIDESETNTDSDEANEVIPNEEVVSWWYKLVPMVHAEEVSSSTEETNLDIDELVVENSDDVVETVSDGDDLSTSIDSVSLATSSSELASSSATTTESQFTWPQETATELTPQFRILYSTLGKEWQILADVATIDPDMRVELPAEYVRSLSDFSELHIRIVPLLQYDKVSPVYLDALWLEIDTEPVGMVGVHSISTMTPEVYKFSDILDTSTSSVDNVSTSSIRFSLSSFSQALRYIEGIDERFVLVGLNIFGTSTELWLFDVEAQTATRLGYDDGELGVMNPLAKDQVIHWLNYTGQKIYSYNWRTPTVIHELLLASNLSKTEERKIDFPFSNNELIWRSENWYSYSPETGEVFGDENSNVEEVFANLFRLRDNLSSEELELLGLTTEVPVETDSPVAE